MWQCTWSIARRGAPPSFGVQFFLGLHDMGRTGWLIVQLLHGQPLLHILSLAEDQGQPSFLGKVKFLPSFLSLSLLVLLLLEEPWHSEGISGLHITEK